MRAYSLSELLNLTRAELLTLSNRIASALPELLADDYAVALENLRRIRCVLARVMPEP